MTRFKTYWKLGGRNLFRIAVYRLKLKAGWYRTACPVVAVSAKKEDYFFPPEASQEPALEPDLQEKLAILEIADNLLAGRALTFGRHKIKVTSPPDWHKNPFTEQKVSGAGAHWSMVPDFSPEFGEIKTIWELSRCEWAVQFAMASRVSGEAGYVAALEDWLEDWERHNPPNQGPNWKCGQEAAIRVMHVLLASAVLAGTNAEKSTARLKVFVAAHARRVAATLPYALAQDNNHGTSEAAALFICGHWLAEMDKNASPADMKQFLGWARIGRRNFEERLARLVLDDGTFSQYSPTYQRVLLATLTQVLMWQKRLEVAAFSPRFTKKSGLALEWLVQLTDPVSGDAPNLGANDGANLFRLSWKEDYRDFRPAIGALAVLLGRETSFDREGALDAGHLWLRELSGPLSHQRRAIHFSTCPFPQGGFEKLVSSDGKSWALLRTANFRFRPPHADIHHLDLWFEGKNILMDSGTYSYAGAPPGARHELKTAFAHNTVTFDGHDQMPALGRFLYGDWPRSRGRHAPDGSWVESTVRFPDGNFHKRRVYMGAGSQWIIIDELDGSFEFATLRWHLADLGWKLETDGGYVAGKVKINVQCVDGILEGSSLKQGGVARYYLASEPCTVLETSVKSTEKKMTITTVIDFTD